LRADTGGPRGIRTHCATHQQTDAGTGRCTASATADGGSGHGANDRTDGGTGHRGFLRRIASRLATDLDMGVLSAVLVILAETLNALAGSR